MRMQDRRKYRESGCKSLSEQEAPFSALVSSSSRKEECGPCCRRLVNQVKRRLDNRQRIEMKRTVEIIAAS